MTNMKWNELNEASQLDTIEEESKEKAILIFKHSTRCSISSASLNRLERKWQDGAGAPKPYFLDLIANRPISDEIASRYKIPHESPQVLIIRDGRCSYTTSHFGISFDDIMENLEIPA